MNLLKETLEKLMLGKNQIGDTEKLTMILLMDLQKIGLKKT
jgi:hypothetical protein